MLITRLKVLARALPRRASPELAAVAALVFLLALNGTRLALKDADLRARRVVADLDFQNEEASQVLAETAVLREMRARDLAHFKDGLTSLTQSRRALYEGGLAIQEEKRILEKQWEIISTYLMVDPEQKKIHLMRGEQSLESYSIAFATAQAFAPPPSLSTAPVAELRPPPPVTVIVSKERFAHPERGKSEQVDGQLQWEPPQVGTSVRANALGEYVMFTRGSLILHGPPKKPAEHQAFPHYCLGLSLSVARRLYANSFIGTKIMLKPAPKGQAGGR